jgi:hypothetical protein
LLSRVCLEESKAEEKVGQKLRAAMANMASEERAPRRVRVCFQRREGL